MHNGYKPQQNHSKDITRRRKTSSNFSIDKTLCGDYTVDFFRPNIDKMAIAAKICMHQPNLNCKFVKKTTTNPFHGKSEYNGEKNSQVIAKNKTEIACTTHIYKRSSHRKKCEMLEIK